MILLPLTVMVQFAIWWLFFRAVDRGVDELLLFGAFTGVLATLLWTVHEAIKQAFAGDD